MTKHIGELDDAWAFDAAASDAAEAYAALYDRLATSVFRHAFARTGNRETAEDIAAQAFLNAWEYLEESQEAVANLRSFIFRVANNLITDHYRKRRFEALPVEDPAARERPDHRKGVPERAADRERVRAAERALATLPEEQRDLLVWRYVDDLSAEEVSALTQKTPNSIYVSAHRALAKLREVLESQGY